jgi:ubiquitin-protein ligase E3 C
MSDYIYGNSLRAAKSKVNYLFEGDFRRRPNQNLSGASRSVARVELLQQAAEQRQNREDTRRKENASVKIQSVWRGYRCRKLLATSMRLKFDDTTKKIISANDSSVRFNCGHFQELSREFIIFYHSQHDAERFNCLIDLMLNNPQVVLESKAQDPKRWLHIITRLLSLNLAVVEKHLSHIENARCMRFLEYFTKPGGVLDMTDEYFVWQSLIGCRFYAVIRQLVEKSIESSDITPKDKSDNKLYLELIRRSLDTDYYVQHERHGTKLNTTYCFFEQFLRWPLHPILEEYYLRELLKECPNLLKPKQILLAFKDSPRLKDPILTQPSPKSLSRAGFKSDDSFRDITWLCFLFVKALHTRTNDFNDLDKVSYINVISHYIAPAEYITNISAILAANEDADEQTEDADEISGSMETSNKSSNQPIHHHNDVHAVIGRLINLINQIGHVDSLKSVVFSDQYQPQVQDAIVRICNLMLSHEYLAIFNCRLLYTIAFSKEFSRSLWRSIMSTTTNSLYGNNLPIYTLISRGSQTISHDSWKSILPKLRLFCSLSSYLLPTLGDDEFYTNENSLVYLDEGHNNTAMAYKDISKNDDNLQETRTQSPGSSSGRSRESSGSISSFYIDRELVGISAILRDICVGMVEILYQSNRQAANSQHTRFNSSNRNHLDMDSNSQNELSRQLLTYEIKSCFQATVRLVCQLHARDSRKQFCPNGHWICPSVIVPANKAIDFQLVTSQKGRLLNQMTRNDQSIDRLASASSEIKTVLILQEIPFVISFHDRVKIFHQLLRKERQLHQSDGYHFGLPGTAISVQIRRNYIYEDAFEKLSFENEPNMKLPLKVSLVNAVGVDEAGIDGGGLTKEFLDELLKAGFDPMRGFFKYTKDHFLYPNPSAKCIVFHATRRLRGTL